MFTRMKARRRIRRYIRTGVHQARVYEVESSYPRLFEYKVKHHVRSWFYRYKTYWGIGVLHKVSRPSF